MASRRASLTIEEKRQTADSEQIREEALTTDEGASLKSSIKDGRAKSEELTEGDLEKAPVAEPHSVFTGGRKWLIVCLITLVGFISPISGAIYLPALPSVASDLKKTTEKIALTVTVYMIFQGISPIVLGGLADTVGRRPVIILCLLVSVAINAGLSQLPDSYVALMLLRCAQAIGSATLLSISAGCVGDITTREERGSLYGYVQSGNLVGPSLGPLIGAALAEGFGWRSIFLFLLCLAGLSLLSVFFLLPETLRSLVGNGSKPAPTLLHEAALSLIAGTTVSQRTNTPRPGLKASERTAGGFLSTLRAALLTLVAPLRLLVHKEVTLSLLCNAVPYTGFFMILTALSTICKNTYSLATLQTGLVFLASGIGSSVAAFATGYILDLDYRRLRKAFDKEQSRNPVAGATFPIAQARLLRYPIYNFMFFASTLAFGWCVEKDVHLAAPTIFTFFAGYGASAIMALLGTLLVDYAPGKGASITSCNNLFRCLLGALGTAVVSRMLDRLGAGWAFTIVAFFGLGSGEFAIALLWKGNTVTK